MEVHTYQKPRNRFKFWSIAVGVTVGALLIIIRLALGSSGTLGPDKVSDSDWVEGDRDAEVVVIEYSDFQCPACAGASEIMNELAKEFGSHVAFVYRNFPLSGIHKNANNAAYAAGAAGLQGKFWEMHDLIFSSQFEWEGEDDPYDDFEGYADELGLNLEEFEKDYNSEDVHEKVESDLESAYDLQLNHTPTFFLNGEEVLNRSYDVFRAAIRDAIEAVE